MRKDGTFTDFGEKNIFKKKKKCLLTRLPHLKCIRWGSVRSSLPILMHVGSIATTKMFV